VLQIAFKFAFNALTLWNWCHEVYVAFKKSCSISPKIFLTDANKHPDYLVASMKNMPVQQKAQSIKHL